MKRLSVILVSVFILQIALKAKTGNDVTVEVSGIKTTRGEISIGLYTNANDFPKTGKAFQGVFVQATGSTILYVFKDVPHGIYAAAVYHDANSNKKLDKNFVGKPVEGYGFSNNKFGMFGPPDFKKVSFEVNSDTTVKIKLEY